MQNVTINQPPNRIEQMVAIQKNALELFTKKNADYGDAFARFGVVGVMVRMEDKLQRFMSISNRGVCLVADEGLKDTLLDLHNYAALALMLLAEEEEKGTDLPIKNGSVT